MEKACSAQLHFALWQIPQGSASTTAFDLAQDGQLCAKFPQTNVGEQINSETHEVHLGEIER